MKLIPLTQGQFAKVDDCRYEVLSIWKWYASKHRSGKFYAFRYDKGKRISMASFVAHTPKGMVADHINLDTLDNQIHNLRNVTYSQNSMNRPVNKNNKLGEKGICFVNISNGRYKRFRVKVEVLGKVYQKDFKTLESAKIYRDDLIKKSHGQYART